MRKIENWRRLGTSQVIGAAILTTLPLRLCCALAEEVKLSASDSATIAAAKLTPTAALTLKEALALTLLKNSELEAYSFEIRAREAAALQAGLPVNPEISFEVENFAGSKTQQGVDVAEATVRLSQLFELGGKREKRAAVAKITEQIANQDYAAARLKVLSDTSKAFISALALEQKLALSAELAKSSQASVKITARLVQAGAATDVELLRSEVAVGQVEAEREREQAELEAAYDQLASFWGGEKSFLKLSGDLFAISEPASLAELLSKIPEARELKRWDLERREKQAALELEKAGAVPDLDLAVGARRYNEDDSSALVAELSLPLPIFNRNQGAIEEATIRLQKSEAERRLAVTQLSMEIRTAAAAKSGAYQEVTRLQRSVIPKARTALAGAREGYERGIFRALEVLDAERTLFAVRAQYIEGLATYHRANADIERILGLSELGLNGTTEIK